MTVTEDILVIAVFGVVLNLIAMCLVSIRDRETRWPRLFFPRRLACRNRR